jgi:hypothetical protein
MELELERDMELFFSNFFEANYHSFSSCAFHVAPSFSSDVQRTFVTLQFANPMTQKSLNLVQE